MTLLAEQIELGPETHEALQAFMGHWESLSEDGNIPTSRKFIETPHPELTPWSYIFEVGVEGTVTCRFMGTAQVDVWGMDFTDLDLTQEFPTDEELNRLNRNHHSVYKHPCGIWDRVTYAQASGLLVPHEQLTLPLAVEDGKPARTVVFSQAGQSLGLSENLRAFSTVEERRWVDLGAGVPAEEPIWP